MNQTIDVIKHWANKYSSVFSWSFSLFMSEFFQIKVWAFFSFSPHFVVFNYMLYRLRPSNFVSFRRFPLHSVCFGEKFEFCRDLYGNFFCLECAIQKDQFKLWKICKTSLWEKNKMITYNKVEYVFQRLNYFNRK